jgi:hypothetical protein
MNFQSCSTAGIFATKLFLQGVAEEEISHFSPHSAMVTKLSLSPSLLNIGEGGQGLAVHDPDSMETDTPIIPMTSDLMATTTSGLVSLAGSFNEPALCLPTQCGWIRVHFLTR